MNIKRSYLLFLVPLLLSGCDFNTIDKIFEKLAGIDSLTVVLLNEPVVISAEGLKLTSKKKMVVLGQDTAVCLVLKSGAKDVYDEVERIVDEAMEEGSVSATLTMKDGGEPFTLTYVGSSWKRYGMFSSGQEVAGCLRKQCEERFTIGSEISEITINTSTPIVAQAIYWDTSNFNEKVE